MPSVQILRSRLSPDSLFPLTMSPSSMRSSNHKYSMENDHFLLASNPPLRQSSCLVRSRIIRLLRIFQSGLVLEFEDAVR